jgi:hypothetical protein
MSSECEWASGLWISFSTGVRLDYSCHHFAQAGDIDLQIITEHENEQIDAAEEVVQGVVEAGQLVVPLEGYCRLTFMMLDRDVVAVSSSSTYVLLKEKRRFLKQNDHGSIFLALFIG